VTLPILSHDLTSRSGVIRHHYGGLIWVTLIEHSYEFSRFCIIEERSYPFPVVPVLGKSILYRFQVKPKIGNLFCLFFVSLYPFPVIPVLGKPSPVLADCSSLDDWNMDPDDIARKITPKTKAVMIVLYPFPVIPVLGNLLPVFTHFSPRLIWVTF